jgi:YaiO family outer membrane protein
MAASGVMSVAGLPATTLAQADPAGEFARAPVDTAVIGAQLSFEHVEGIDPWVMLSAHRTFVPRWGVAVARFTGGQRFGFNGVQGEVEAYPRVGRAGYLYAAAAISPHEEVFVPLRAALELFSSPTPPMELSAGARLFHAASQTIVAYTGSIGGYRGNYWYAFRPYVVQQSGSLSTTGQLSLRRYWAGRYDYVGMYLSATRGTDPTVDDPSRLSRDPDLTTFSARIERLRPVRSGRVRLGYGMGVESEEVAPSVRRLHLVATVRVERLLR